MWAIALKEFRQVRRDHRLVALMVVMPVVMLVVFGYAASFDVSQVRTVVTGPQAERLAAQLPAPLEVTDVRPGDGREAARQALVDGEAMIAVVTGAPGDRPLVLLDGSQLFAARAAQTALAKGAAGGAAQGVPQPQVEVLFNPGLDTSTVMVPGLMGVVLVFVGTVITSLGVVRERQAGTLEQLTVMPFKPRDVIAGKVAPYFLVAIFDMTLIVVAGLLLFGVPFNGSPLLFALAAAMFLLVTLGVGVLISTVSQNQGQAVMLALMTMLPQILLSGLIFPVEAMAAGVRWIAYLLPLKYFIDVSRGVLLRGAGFGALWLPLTMLAVLGVLVFGLAIARFRRDLAPKAAGEPARPEPALAQAGAR
jgi:ABC-2 type transport system permease protein